MSSADFPLAGHLGRETSPDATADDPFWQPRAPASHDPDAGRGRRDHDQLDRRPTGQEGRDMRQRLTISDLYPPSRSRDPVPAQETPPLPSPRPFHVVVPFPTGSDPRSPPSH
ncbi:hypothetical protein CMUS01_09807 [Colletotrichum musicola]|uniref:Uncharacterized protein n=1 Tax=Colletotrichum musicola TaxID=2175873 RepID=A0A8H6K6T7_9PEZI|nr:hypothetical protein CMUS01_09807 [Colletotrichum musicola]